MSGNSFMTSDSNNDSVSQLAGAVRPLSDDDFVMMCPFDDRSLSEAILSLYYLPPQFKLRVLIDAESAKLPFTDHEDLVGRILLETETGTPNEVSPFSTADAVVYSEATPVKSESATPRVVISKAAHTLKNSDDNVFMISEDSPEALASAMLRIAKTAA